jgi:hypothetical protein
MNRRPKDRRAKPIQERLDTTGFAFPKPGAREKAQPKDGRLIESPRQYRATKRQMWERQHGRCARIRAGKECGKFMPTPAYGHRHHPGGRGLGGGKRDDSKTVLWCIDCHKEEHRG